MGFRGVGMRMPMLAELPSLRFPPACFLADDVAITYYLSRVRRYRIVRLKLRTKYKFDADFAWSNSSINAIHRAKSFRINRACVNALLSPARATPGVAGSSTATGLAVRTPREILSKSQIQFQ